MHLLGSNTSSMIGQSNINLQHHSKVIEMQIQLQDVLSIGQGSIVALQ
jgi:hypothetical protein